MFRDTDNYLIGVYFTLEKNFQINHPGKNTGVGCHFLLQGIFPAQGSNLCLVLEVISCIAGGFFYQLSHQGSPGAAVGVLFFQRENLVEWGLVGVGPR